MIDRARGLLGTLLLLGCGLAATDAKAKGLTTPGPEAEPRPGVAAWLRAHAPKGAEISAHEGEPIVTYETKDGDTLASIARALLPLSETYLWSDFADELVKANPPLRSGVKAGMRVTIPNVVRQAYASADEARLAWPKDTAVRGVYVRGSTAGGTLVDVKPPRQARRARDERDRPRLEGHRRPPHVQIHHPPRRRDRGHEGGVDCRPRAHDPLRPRAAVHPAWSCAFRASTTSGCSTTKGRR